MNAAEIKWTYGFMKADGGMDVVFHVGPLPSANIAALLGGPYKLIPFQDGTVAAVRADSEGLPSNHHWPDLKGDVVLGKVADGAFLGVLGVMNA